MITLCGDRDRPAVENGGPVMQPPPPHEGGQDPAARTPVSAALFGATQLIAAHTRLPTLPPTAEDDVVPPTSTAPAPPGPIPPTSQSNSTATATATAIRPLPVVGRASVPVPVPLPVPDPGETPATIRARALALVEYLLSLRGLVESPTRTVPQADAYWHDDLPEHPDCGLGPAAGGAWLRIGRPGPPPPPRIHSGLLRHLLWDLSSAAAPTPRPVDDGVLEPVQAEFTQWYERQWLPWSREHSAAEATARLHDRLYEVRNRVDSDGARLELVWGHLVLHARLGSQNQTVQYPLLATPVLVDYDPEQVLVTVSPQGPPRLQVDALADLDPERVAALLELAGPGGQVDLDVWDRPAREEFARQAMERLGLEPLLLTDGDEPTERPYVYDTGVLFVRTRQRMVRRFLERLRDRLTDDPDAHVGALAGLLAHEPSRLRLPDDDQLSWQRSGSRLLLPLPTNDAQASIARRLAADRNVAVQGPPGTGKTHTIRNLICHLVAHGKRVLVVAQKEDPLRLLRDGLPPEIQSLCLAVLGRSTDQLEQVRVAARELADRASTVDSLVATERIRRMGAEIRQAEQALAEAQAQLHAAAERESAQYTLAGMTATVSEVGDWLRRHEGLDLIPDPIPSSVEPPLSGAEFATLFDLARRLAPADRTAALDALPPDGQLPSGEVIAARRAAQRQAQRVVDMLRDRGVALDAIRQLGPDGLGRIAARLRAEGADLARSEVGWTSRLTRLVRDPGWHSLWDDHVGACRDLLSEVARRNTFLAGRRVEVPDERAARPRRLLAQLGEIRERFLTGKSFRRLTHAELVHVVGECQVDGEPLSHVQDVDLVVAAVEQAQLRRELTTRWIEWEGRLGVRIRPAGPPPPAPNADAQPPEFWVSRLLTEAAQALTWERHRWPTLYASLHRLLPDCPPAVDSRQLGEVTTLIERCGDLFLADQIEAERQAMTDWLRMVSEEPTAAAVVRTLALVWEADDDVRWDQCLATIRRLWRIRPDAVRYAQLLHRLATVAPRWAADIDAGRVPANTQTAQRAWQWRQAQCWYEQVVGSVDVSALARRIDQYREQIARRVRETVVTSAWWEISLALTDRRKAALADWAAALSKIGKGGGAGTAHWQAAAQRAVTEAVAAVPVWIMSIDRALEQFQDASPLFDVVIVDEASQADVFSLPVLALGRRSLVVGDDQQIGPQWMNLPPERVNALIASHLVEAGVPSAEHFDAGTSLYDHAVRRCTQRILLTEHFRSVPAIIGFSNEYYYGGRVLPLRADRPAGLGPPVVAIRVADGTREAMPGFGEVNVAEAEALVAQAARLAADPLYAERTIGVVSLHPEGGQAAYLHRRLYEELGAEELERRALRVGDPYAFQGDERDVVLLSMATTVDGLSPREQHRRLNVAASRARDQLWLFYSEDPAELRPDDARALLLSYAARPGVATAEQQSGRCETDLEYAVLRKLTAAGLRPIPKFRMGTGTVDLMLTAPSGARLAIECDGDRYLSPEAFAHELRRQAVAERVGNCVFVRLRASVFYRDPDAAMRPVWQWVDELGIPRRR